MKLGLLALLGLALAWTAALAFPQPLFRHSVRHGGYQVWSDRPIDPNIGAVLDDATRRLKTSELYDPARPIRIFFCNSPWKLWFYSQRFSSRMGGVADTWLTHNVYLREVDVAHNQLVRRDPTIPMPDAAQRPLSYYIAHEATHILEARAFGRLMSVRYPQWLKEGYADYVGKGGDFDYAENRRLFLAGDRLLDWQASGLYRRFHLDVAFLLDREHRSVRDLFNRPPQQTDVEARLKAVE